MLFLEDIKIELKSQGFEAKQISFSPTNDSAVVGAVALRFDDLRQPPFLCKNTFVLCQMQ